MASKKTAAKKKATQVGRTGSSIPAATATHGSTNKYETIGDVMRAASKGALPRGAKFVIANGRARLCVNTKNAGVTLYDGDAAEVARWGLRKAGFKADHAV
jgi:hypothetical protein